MYDLSKIEDAIALVEEHASYCDCAGTYAERGYDDPERAILFANWNKVPREIQVKLEEAGYSLEWSDEWLQSSDKAYRTKADCYSWTPYYVLTDDGEVVGGDEIEEDPTWYVEEYLLNDPDHCNVFDINLAKLGFKPIDQEFETGWHPGQTDDPHKVFERLQDEMPDHDFVFDLKSQGQFDAHWRVWSRPQS